MGALFDSHCHLDFDDFASDRTAVMARAEAAGVAAIMIPGVSRRASSKTRISSASIELFYGVGLHPYFIAEHDYADIDWLEQQLQRCPHAVVGEVGLDRSCSDYRKQQQLFTAQVELACAYQRPLIIHHRQSQADLVAILTRYRSKLPAHAGVIHAFSGSYEQAQSWLALGFMIGVGGVISYQRAAKTRSTIARLPLESLVLETDAPAMPLAGYQGQRNEPAQLLLVVDALAQLSGWSTAQIAAQTSSNAYRLFANR
jgi:TatD DNase family protein